jgi:hypothetical protein
MDKKIGLEHTIRNVVSESIGVSGTDKFQGTPRAFLRPAPLITPKKEGEHPNGSVNLAQRGRAKIDTSNDRGTMSLEGKIGVEHTIRSLLEGGKKAPDAKTTLKDLFGIDLEIPTNKGDLVPYEPKVPSTTTTIKTDQTTKTDVETKPAVKTDQTTKTDVETKPAVKTNPQTKTDTKTAVKTNPQTKTDTKTAVKTNPKSNPKGNPKGSFVFPLLNIDGTPISGPRDYVPAEIYVHHANKRKTFGEDFNSDAMEIKQKSRKAQIIRKILDEKKKKDTETVNMNPKLKPQDLGERYTKRAGALLGVASGASEKETGLQAQIDKQQKKLDPYNPVLNKKDTWYKSKEYDSNIYNPTSDFNMDLASMIPVVGAVPSAIQAYRNLERGDYVNAGLDALGVIPGAGLLTKGLKFFGKAGKATSTLGKVGETAKRIAVPISHATDTKGGLTAVKPGIIDRASRTGKAIDRASNVADTISGPGNMYQLGTQAGQFGREVHDLVKAHQTNGSPTSNSNVTSTQKTKN